MKKKLVDIADKIVSDQFFEIYKKMITRVILENILFSIYLFRV